MIKVPAQVRSVETRARLLAAARTVVVEEGYAAATARRTAEAAGVNQALVFYHYGGMQPLLLAALDASSDQRMQRYREELGDVRSLGGLLKRAAALYEEDRATGHVALLTQMIAGALGDRTLAADVQARVEPWVQLTTEAVDRVLRRTPLRRIVPAQELGVAIVAMYLGLEVLTSLGGDASRAEAVLTRLERIGARLERMGAPWRA